MCGHKFLILFLIGFLFSGCIARSAHVNRNSELIADNGEVIAVLQKKISEKFPDLVSPQDLARAIENAKAQIVQANKSSAVVSKETVDAVVKTATKSVSGYFGIPPGIVERPSSSHADSPVARAENAATQKLRFLPAAK